jgi:hypothetical protein
LGAEAYGPHSDTSEDQTTIGTAKAKGIGQYRVVLFAPDLIGDKVQAIKLGVMNVIDGGK